MVLVAVPEGIKAVQEKYPDVNIYAGALTITSTSTVTSFLVSATRATASSARSNPQ